APNVSHTHAAQKTSVDHGRMDHFDLIHGCSKVTGYACYEQYQPGQVPNLSALARAFVISDRTFEGVSSASWGSHLVLVAAQMDGVIGDNPGRGQVSPGPGWGCNSFRDARWIPPGATTWIKVPSCVPNRDGSGPYRPSPVQWIPTIMDRLDAGGISWRIFTPADADGA